MEQMLITIIILLSLGLTLAIIGIIFLSLALRNIHYDITVRLEKILLTLNKKQSWK